MLWTSGEQGLNMQMERVKRQGEQENMGVKSVKELKSSDSCQKA